MRPSILVVDDEKTIQETLQWSLEQEGYRVFTAGDGEAALARMESHDFDVIITDIIMPGLGGLDLLEKARRLNPRAAVILITAYATVETAVEALRKGASDYVLKPFIIDDLKFRIGRLLRCRAAFQENQLLRRTLEHSVPEHTIIGESAAIRVLRGQIAKIAVTSSNVLITGESGTGKELAARAVHAASGRHAQAFVPINCGAIPEALLESQLFGHVRGAFTTAVQANPGLFLVANHGTLFLDEIGEMPLHLQVKLLRAIEEKGVWPVGGVKPVPVDVRIIASTNRDLEEGVEIGLFRRDLFYRLNVVRLALPPLSERRGDVPLLVDHFIHRLNVKLSTRFLGIDREALRVLVNHEWKGNVRELENVLERAMILGEGDLLTVRDLPHDVVASQRAAVPAGTLKDATRELERRRIQEALARTQFDKREAARLLGISLASLYRKLDQSAG